MAVSLIILLSRNTNSEYQFRNKNSCYGLQLHFISRQKQNAIAKMSANRVESHEYPIDIISKLSHASIVYELLSVRHNKVVNTEYNTSNKDS